MSDKKTNWIVDGPNKTIIYQTHYTPRFTKTGKAAPAMEDLMLVEVTGEKVSRMKYYWSNPGAVTNMVTEESIFKKLGHMFNNETSAPFLDLDPDATSELSSKEAA